MATLHVARKEMCFGTYTNAGSIIPLVVDATKELGRLARLMSHANLHRKRCNSCAEVIIWHGKPQLILHATWDIKKGEELAYDYGEIRPAVVQVSPWLLAKKRKRESGGKERESESESKSDSAIDQGATISDRFA